MKKYIILISLCCFALFQAKADEKALPQDTIKEMMKNFDILVYDLKNELAQMDFDFEFDPSAFKDVMVDLNFDSIKMQAMDEALKEGLEDMKSNIRNMKTDIAKNVHVYVYNNKENQDGNPTRVEKKTFSNISEIKFSHSYGNIVVRESSSKQVELEIQYFDKKNQQAVSKNSVANKLLSISSSSVGKGGSRAKINYIINIPRNTALNVDLKYGDIKMDSFNGPFRADLSYSNLSSQGFVNANPSIEMRYSDLKIGEVNDIKISGSYSDTRIKKAGKIEIMGNYNDYVLGEVQTLVINGISSYDDIRVNTLGHFQGNLKYADISVDNLLAGMDIITAYGDIIIKNVSPKLKNINVKGSYSDVYITIPQNISVSFDMDLNYGDLNVAKKYDVKYTESIEQRNRTIRKGQIGAKTPTATIAITNSYADVTIK